MIDILDILSVVTPFTFEGEPVSDLPGSMHSVVQVFTPGAVRVEVIGG